MRIHGIPFAPLTLWEETDETPVTLIDKGGPFRLYPMAERDGVISCAIENRLLSGPVLIMQVQGLKCGHLECGGHIRVSMN